MTDERLRLAGLDALKERLGPGGMARFLKLYSLGSGNYTEERRPWVQKTALTDLVRQARRRSRRRPPRKP